METAHNHQCAIAAQIAWTRPRAVTLGTLKGLVGAFEAGQLSARQWTHRTRLVVGLWHGLCASPTGAHGAMRRGIMACRANLGLTGGGYHRTRTEFFLKMIGAFAIAAPREFNLVSLANALLTSALTRADLADAFYTPARLSSAAARDTWLEPDLRALAWPALVGGKPARCPTLCGRSRLARIQRP